MVCEEIFAPVLSVIPFDSFDEAVDAGQLDAVRPGRRPVHPRHQPRDRTAPRRLHVGVVHINEPSSSRVDLMPFAGVKDSGVGAEGPRYAMREMTEERLVTISSREGLSTRIMTRRDTHDRRDVHGRTA